MTAFAHEILGRNHRPGAVMVADRSRFRLGPPMPTPLDDMTNWHLWTFDLDRREALFVDCESEVDLSAPFLYLEQFERARRLIAVDLSTFVESSDHPAEPAPGDLTWLLTTGRAGSTWLHRLLSGSDRIVSLSEPDAPTALALHRRDLEVGDLDGLLGATTQFLRHRYGQKDSPLVVKLRLETTPLMPRMVAAMPEARFVFLYRQPVPFVQSMDRLAGSRHGRRQWLLRTPLVRGLVRAWRARRLRGVGERSWPLSDLDGLRFVGSIGDLLLEVGWAGEPLLSWLTSVAAYRRARDLRPEVVAVRYEDLVERRREVLLGLMSYLGLPASEIDSIDRDIDSDVQAGTDLARPASWPYPLDARTVVAIRRAVDERTDLDGDDVVLPGTLRPDQESGR